MQRYVLEAHVRSGKTDAVGESHIDQLCWLLREHGFKQDALASALDVSPSTVSRWLRSRAVPQPRHRKQITQLYQETRRFEAALKHALDELTEGHEDCDEPA